jgi:hypothetical protein
VIVESHDGVQDPDAEFVDERSNVENRMERLVINRTARCSCGQLSAAIAGEPLRSFVCYCLACQLRTGSAFGAQARFRSSEVQINGNTTVYTRVADSGKTVAFHFCPICGSSVYYLLPEQLDAIGIMFGAFAGQPLPSPTVAHYEARKQDWLEIKSISEHHP